MLPCTVLALRLGTALVWCSFARRRAQQPGCPLISRCGAYLRPTCHPLSLRCACFAAPAPQEIESLLSGGSAAAAADPWAVQSSSFSSFNAFLEGEQPSPKFATAQMAGERAGVWVAG